ncbi:MAG: MBL fold metallo-hydrolase [Acidobacteria bacterium]|nr:MBL fold metallo-hydrolase [Acidobacteriota bacterium]
MIVDSIPVGMFQCNCYLIGDEKRRTGVLIDPGAEGDEILAMVARHGVEITDIIVTHAHLDHVCALDPVRAATNARVHMNPRDLPLFREVSAQGKLFGLRVEKPADPENSLAHEQRIACGDLTLRIIETPGHSPGSVSVLVEDQAGIVFTGDTLFAGSIGRTDLWGGSYEEIIESIKARLLPLGRDVTVYPGHGCATTVGEEKESNPFLVPGLAI